MTEHSTDLVIAAGTDLTAIVTDETKTDEVVERIERDAREAAKAFDPQNRKDREAAKSLAHKVSRSKTALDGAGKALNDERRKELDAVDKHRRVIRERLDSLRDEIKKPALDWEAKDEERKAAHQRVVDALKEPGVDHASPSAAIKNRMEEIAKTDVSGLEEFVDEANNARLATLQTLDGMHKVAVEREEQAAELARLRAAEEERQREERERAEREAAQKAEQDRQARERAEAEERAERERLAKERAEREKAEAAKIAAAAERERANREIAEANARAERSAQAERDRIAEIKRQADEARQKREADEAHRARILSEIKEALAPIPREDIAAALMDGRVPHVKVML